MSKRHPLDDAFQNKLRDYSMPVPPEMWQNIEGEMSRKRYPIWLPWIMGTASIATLALVGYLLLTFDANSKDKTDNSSEPTADATMLQYIDNEEDKYKMSGNLPVDKVANEDVENSANNSVVEEGLISSSESLGAESTELTVETYRDDRERSSLVNSKQENTNTKRGDQNQTSSGLTNFDKAKSQVKTSASPEKIGDYPLAERSEEKYTDGEDAFVETANRADRDKSALSDVRTDLSRSVTVPASINDDAPRYYILSDYGSMGLPKLRKIRDRNCEDEHFSPGNIFLEFSYSLHHGSFKFQSTDAIFDSYADLRKNGERFNISRQFQGLIAFQVGKRAYFKTGISLNILESDYYFVDQVNKRTILDSIWNPQTMKYDVTEKAADIYIDGVNRYTFIDIPLLFSYGWQFNKVGMNLTTGPMINISFSREGSLPNLDGQGIDLDGGLWNDRDIYRKTAGLSWFLSTQISYQAHRNVDVYIEPRIISGLNSITLENDGTEVDVSKTSYPLSQRIFQYGIGAGLRFSLNNN